MSVQLTYTVREVLPYINWIYYFHAWGMEPRFATITEIHDCPACRTSWIASFPIEDRPKALEAATLYDEAKEQLRLWADEPMCHAVFLLTDAYSQGDDIIVGHNTRIPFLRQQHPSKSGYTFCLSDFIASTSLPKRDEANIANRIGLFAASISLPPSSQKSTLDVQISTLSDRLSEATAEKMHEEIRKHYWGYAENENLSIRELHKEQYQGIRPAVGYPSLPDQSINFLIDKLLHFSDIGITLTENGAMHPHCSVSGFMFAHPKAQYFSIGSIGKDQLRDYACRRELSIEQMKKFLSTTIKQD